MHVLWLEPPQKLRLLEKGKIFEKILKNLKNLQIFFYLTKSCCTTQQVGDMPIKWSQQTIAEGELFVIFIQPRNWKYVLVAN